MHHSDMTVLFRIVEFGGQEDSQRAIRELSEQPLLGRPVFIREVGIQLEHNSRHTHEVPRTEKMNHVSVRHLYLAK
jgi:hypothetical protein